MSWRQGGIEAFLAELLAVEVVEGFVGGGEVGEVVVDKVWLDVGPPDVVLLLEEPDDVRVFFRDVVLFADVLVDVVEFGRLAFGEDKLVVRVADGLSDSGELYRGPFLICL
jgi:hypothetical protein